MNVLSISAMAAAAAHCQPAAFVSNLPADATEAAVRAAFEAAGVPVVNESEQRGACRCMAAACVRALDHPRADQFMLPPAHATRGHRQSSVQLLKKGPSWRSRSAGLACVTLGPGADVAASCAALDGVPLLDRPMIVRRDRFAQDQHSYDPAAAAAAAAAGEGAVRPEAAAAAAEAAAAE